MAKYIHNPTGSAIRYMGVPVPAGGSYEIPLEKYPSYSVYQRLLTDITNEVVTISRDGVNPLSAAAGLNWITTVYPAQSGGFDNSNNELTSDTVQAAIEELASNNIGLTVSRTFYRPGNPGNKWLLYHEDTSDNVPAIIPFNCKLVAVSFTNDNTGVDIGVELYKNGTSIGNRVLDWSITDKQYAYKTSGLGQTFSAGDRLSVFIDDHGTDGNDASVVVEFLVTDNQVGEG